MTKKLLAFTSILSLILAVRILTFYSNKTIYRDGEYLSFQATIFSEPKFSSSYQNFLVQTPNGNTVFISAWGYPEYSYGQDIIVSGNLRYKVLNKSKILTMSFPKISLAQIAEINIWQSLIFSAKK